MKKSNYLLRNYADRTHAGKSATMQQGYLLRPCRADLYRKSIVLLDNHTLVCTSKRIDADIFKIPPRRIHSHNSRSAAAAFDLKEKIELLNYNSSPKPGK